MFLTKPRKGWFTFFHFAHPVRLAISTTVEASALTVEHKKLIMRRCKCQSRTVTPDYFHVSVERLKREKWWKIIGVMRGGWGNIAKSKLVRVEEEEEWTRASVSSCSLLEQEGHSTVKEPKDGSNKRVKVGDVIFWSCGRCVSDVQGYTVTQR